MDKNIAFIISDAFVVHWIQLENRFNPKFCRKRTFEALFLMLFKAKLEY
jgi:hypothetical protein